MRKLLLLGSACLLFFRAQAQYDCASAFAVEPDALIWVNGIDGTEVPQPNCAPTSGEGEGGMWYTYTPVLNHMVRVTTDLNINAGRDTRLHVYTGACGELTCFAGDDDSGAGALATVTFEAQQGTTYTIAFDDRWDDGGFTFMVEEFEPTTSGVSFNPVNYGGSSSWCVVDMNADGLDDIVSAGTSSVVIHHQQFGGGFEVQNSNITLPATHFPSWSLAAGDVDANGYMDLVYGGGSGVSFMLASDDGTSFGAVNFSQYVFSQRSNFVDINNDGNLDAFMCHDVDANVYFFNDGAGNLTFNQGMLGPNGGNYGSIWTDYDDDGDIDMFIAKCGSSPPDVLMRNNGDGTFTDVAGPLGFADGHQSWSSAWGDYDNDGDLDVLVGSSSSSYHK
ncbi:MAG TPA: VCBS repeat-containing protein, partial [Flavobacteriales bacterium]